MTESREPHVAGPAAPRQEPTNGLASGQALTRARYSRVLLKLGGEMFGGGQVGLDPDVVALVAQQIAEVVRGGVQVAVVIGGGNFFRGRSCSSAAWNAPVRITWECWAPS